MFLPREPVMFGILIAWKMCATNSATIVNAQASIQTSQPLRSPNEGLLVLTVPSKVEVRKIRKPSSKYCWNSLPLEIRCPPPPFSAWKKKSKDLHFYSEFLNVGVPVIFIHCTYF